MFSRSAILTFLLCYTTCQYNITRGQRFGNRYSPYLSSKSARTSATDAVSRRHLISPSTICGGHFENDQQEDNLERSIKLGKLPFGANFKYSFTLTRRRFLQCRSAYYPTGTASYNPSIIKLELSGDVHPMPGPTATKCPVCTKAVSQRHYRYVCEDCKQISHAKCTQLAVNTRNINTKCQAWKCDSCSLQTIPFFHVMNLTVCSEETDESAVITDISSSQTSEPWIIEKRKRNSTHLLFVHLNINSIRNKFDDLKILNRELKSHIIFLTETKIDSSYPSAQFHLEGYHIYRKDRAKGGGGLMAYFSSKIISRQVKLPKQYKLIEVLAINAMINNNDVLFVGIYRPPKVIGSNYYLKLEMELNSICMWATMECKTAIFTGDLILDRLRPENTEGQLLINLEEVYGLECLITEPTRIACTSATLLDVILTNKPEHFRASGVFNPEISDHHLIYGIMKDKVFQHQRKVITFRSTKALDVEKFNEDLKAAPWNVMDTFDTLEDKYEYWKSLFNSVVEEHMPTKKMRLRKVDVPYMTPEWRKAIKMKRT